MRLKISMTLSNFFCKRSPDPVASLLTNRVQNIFKNVDYCLIETTVQAYFFWEDFFSGGGGGRYLHPPTTKRETRIVELCMDCRNIENTSKLTILNFKKEEIR